MSRLRSVVRDLVGQLLYQVGLTRPGRRGSEVLTVVTFHRVLPAPLVHQYAYPGLAVTPEELTWFLGFFSRYFHCGPLREAIARWSGFRADKPPLAITFDDGQLDNYLHARPALEALGLRATFFVVTDAATTGGPLWHDDVATKLAWVSKHRKDALEPLLRSVNVDPSESATLAHACVGRLKGMADTIRRDWLNRLAEIAPDTAPPEWDGMMTWSQVREMSASGHEIGSHTKSHPILPRCGDDTLVTEIEGSKRAIETEIGGDVVSFCYPNGDHDPRVHAAVRQAGYATAVTTQWGTNGRHGDRWLLRRCDLQSATSRSFRGNLSPARVAWRLSGLHPGLR